jgi:hypothetical protein
VLGVASAPGGVAEGSLVMGDMLGGWKREMFVVVVGIGIQERWVIAGSSG